MTPLSPRILAVDTGGTFTDVLCITDGALSTHKLLSSPDDPSRAVLAGVAVLGDGAPGERGIHGTTGATNALLERTGARTALITNAGFEDLLHIGRQERPQLYRLDVRRPEPLIPPDLCFGIPGRMDKDGRPIEALDLSSLGELTDALERAGIESVVIALLHSYANPAHEVALATALAAATSERGLRVDITTSHTILCEFREVERAGTAAINAYVRPRMEGYLGHLADSLGDDTVRIMQSNGGSASVSHTRRRPVHTILSGPAGGVVGAMHMARLGGFERILTLDMGGTSTDVALCDGAAPITHQVKVDGWSVNIPMLDIPTVGAGGGSLAFQDPGGGLQVGPASAGANPGPACYGRGGSAPTVTDANLLRGHLVADRFLGGEMSLDPDAARHALEELAEAFDMTLPVLVEGICAVANAVMARALKRISVSRGSDPADFTLVAFGGAGGMHACDLAEEIGSHRVLIPPHPGLLSALGMLVSDVEVTSSKTLLAGANPGDEEALSAAAGPAFDALSGAANEALEAEGIPPEERRILREADIRYRGQSFELRVGFGPGMLERFHEAHQRTFGFSLPDEPVELVTARVTGIGSTANPDFPRKDCVAHAAEPTGSVRMLRNGDWLDGALFQRERLAPGASFTGPALITEYSATLAIPPLWSGHVDEHGNLILIREASS